MQPKQTNKWIIKQQLILKKCILSCKEDPSSVVGKAVAVSFPFSKTLIFRWKQVVAGAEGISKGHRKTGLPSHGSRCGSLVKFLSVHLVPCLAPRQPSCLCDLWLKGTVNITCLVTAAGVHKRKDGRCVSKHDCFIVRELACLGLELASRKETWSREFLLTEEVSSGEQCFINSLQPWPLPPPQFFFQCFQTKSRFTF